MEKEMLAAPGPEGMNFMRLLNHIGKLLHRADDEDAPLPDRMAASRPIIDGAMEIFCSAGAVESWDVAERGPATLRLSVRFAGHAGPGEADFTFLEGQR